MCVCISAQFAHLMGGAHILLGCVERGVRGRELSLGLGQRTLEDKGQGAVLLVTSVLYLFISSSLGLTREEGRGGSGTEKGARLLACIYLSFFLSINMYLYLNMHLYAYQCTSISKIRVYIHTYVYSQFCGGVARPRAESRPRPAQPGRKRTRGGLAFTRDCFTSNLYCGSQSSFHCPPLPAKPTLLQYHCAK